MANRTSDPPAPSGLPPESYLNSSFLDSIGEALILVDLSGRVRRMNRAALTLLGYQNEEVVGREISEYVARADFVKGRGLSHLLQPSVEHEWEAEFLAKSGQQVPMALHAAHLHDPEGQVQAVVILGSDLRPERQLEELRVLHAVASAGAEATDEDGLIERVTAIIGGTFYPDNCGVVLFDEHAGVLRPHPSYRGTTAEALEMSFGLEDGIVGRVFTSGQVRRVADVRTVPYYLEVNPGVMRSELCVPLKIGTRVIGVINAESRHLDFFSLDDERLMTTVAGQLATAIERVRLFEAERDQRRLAEALREVGASLSAVLDFDVILDRLLEQIARVVPYDAASVLLVEGGRAVVTRMRGYEIAGDETIEEMRTLSFPLATTANLRRMAETKQPHIVSDTHADPDWVPNKGTEYFHSWAGAPILVQGELAAIFSLNKIEPGFYQPQHTEQLSAFAGQAALAMQNARLFEESIRRTQELSGLYRTVLATGSVLGTEALLERLYEQVRQLLSPDSFGVVLFHEETQELEIALAIEEGEPQPFGGLRVPLEQGGLSGWVLANRSTLFIRDVEQDPLPVEPKHLTRPARSWLGVPLLARDRLIGVVSVQAFEADAFDDSDRRFLEAVSGQVAIALEHARLFEETEQRAQEAETLRSSSAVVTSTLRLDEAIDRILEQLAKVVPYDSASVQLLRDDALEIVGGRGWEDIADVVGIRFPIEADNPNSIVIQRRKPHILSDAPAEHAPFREEPHSHIRSWLGVPLIAHERVIGMLALDSVERGYFTPAHARLVAAFADHVTIALENARLFEAIRRQAEELGTLLQVSTELRAASNLQDVLEITLLRTTEAVGCVFGSIYLVEEATGDLVARGHHPPDVQLTDLRHARGEGVTGRVAETGELIFIEDIRSDPRVVIPDQETAHLEQVQSSISIPLRTQEETIGVLQLGMPREKDITADELRLLMAIAEIAGNAMHRARVLETLEQRVHERTLDLELANERLRELDRLKSDFVSNVSHELRTPITNILLYLDLLSQPGSGPRRARYMSVLHTESTRLARLIEDLLMLSRIEQHPEQLRLEPHHIDDLIQEVVTTYDARARAKHTIIQHEPNPDVPRLVLDREQMVQVFSNLIGNAIAYTPEGGDIRAHAERKTMDGRPFIVVEVFNAGPRIPEEDLPHIFERFYRGRTGRESGEPGTGLGLAISKEIVDRHGGRIEVSSDDSGTCFTVHLPCC